MEKQLANCAACPFKMTDRLCKMEGGKSPESCPTKNKPDLIQNSQDEYKNPDIFEFARQASIQEGEAYGNKEEGYARVIPIKPRILEIMEFSRKMRYERLGIAFCMGLRKEAKVVEKYYRTHGFETVSVSCKAGRVPKESIRILEEQKIDPGNFETMCNPILQAMVLNDAQTQFNIMIGLCVGHDSLFMKYAEAMSTVLAVKDRLLGHNPLAAVYNMDSYYRSLKVVDS